jgi:hydrogenase maturation protease
VNPGVVILVEEGSFMNILVLGVGNLLLMDEGVGVRAIEALLEKFEIPPEIDLVDGGTAGMELLGQLQDRDALIILDAVNCGKPAGTVVRMEGPQVPALLRRKISPHQLGLSDLLAAARMTDRLPPKLVLFGVQPKEMDTGLGLSPEVAASLQELVLMTALELEALGVSMVLKGAPRKIRKRPEDVVEGLPLPT